MATTKKTAAKAAAKTETAKEASAKAEAVKAEPAKKAEAVKAEPAKKTAAKKTAPRKTAPRKTAPKKATETKVSFYVEFGGVQVDIAEVVKNVKATYGADAKEISVYLKPEESKAYFVADGVEQDMDVFFC